MAKKAYVSKKETGALTCRLDSINYDMDSNGSYTVDIITWGHSKDNTDVDCKIVYMNGEEAVSKIDSIAYENLLRSGEVTNEDNIGCYKINVINKTNELKIQLSTKADTVEFYIPAELKKAVWKRRKELVFKLFTSITPRRVAVAIPYICKYGIKGFRKKLVDTAEGNACSLEDLYPGWYKDHKRTAHEIEEQAKVKFEYSPKISIIVPTYNTPIVYLKEMIDSVVNQSYSNWELCIADGSEGNKKLEEVLEEYHNKDTRIVYKILEKNLGIAGNTNAALELATGEIVALLDHDDLITPDALFEAVKAFQEEGVDVVYTDEDKILGPKWNHCEPNFKPDFNIDLLRSYNYITHFFLVKRAIVNEVGGFSSKYDGAQDYDLILRCTEKARKVRHVHRVLYQWRMHANSTAANPESKLYCHEAGKRAIEDHLERLGIKGEVSLNKIFGQYRVKYPVQGNPLLSIIIPNKDHTDDLDKCIRSVINNSTYKNFEIVVIENNSTDEKTFKYYEQVQKEFEQVKVVTWEREFNYSAINNFGVKFSKGEYLLLLNNDTEMIAKDSIEDMLGMCQREDVGIVGARLLYEDDTVQHAGVIIGLGGIAGHAFSFLNAPEPGFMSRAVLNADYSAVTAACLMVSRKTYDKVGGLCEDYAVAFNDVDFCMKVRKEDLLVVYDAYSEWHHYESKSRGFEDTPEKLERFYGEADRFKGRWPEIMEKGDPYYNKNFPLDYESYKLKPEV